MDNVYEKLFNETIEVGDIISQNAINNKVYKSCNYKKDRIIGVCTNVNNNEITISNINLNPVLSTNGGDISIYEVQLKNNSSKYKDLVSQKASIIRIDSDLYTHNIPYNELTTGSLIIKG